MISTGGRLHYEEVFREVQHRSHSQCKGRVIGGDIAYLVVSFYRVALIDTYRIDPKVWDAVGPVGVKKVVEVVSDNVVLIADANGVATLICMAPSV